MFQYCPRVVCFKARSQNEIGLFVSSSRSEPLFLSLMIDILLMPTDDSAHAPPDRASERVEEKSKEREVWRPWRGEELIIVDKLGSCSRLLEYRQEEEELILIG